MAKPMKKFSYCKKINIKTQFRIVKQMEVMLVGLHSGKIPGKEYNATDLKRACRSLVKGIRYDLGAYSGTWCVEPTADIESEARVDFVYNPTYLAVSILALVLSRHREIAESIPGYTKALNNGLRAATGRQLCGHGYDMDSGRLKALKWFAMGRVPQYVVKSQGFNSCPNMMKVLGIAKSAIKEAGVTYGSSAWDNPPVRKMSDAEYTFIMESLDGIPAIKDDLKMPSGWKQVMKKPQPPGD